MKEEENISKLSIITAHARPPVIILIGYTHEVNTKNYDADFQCQNGKAYSDVGIYALYKKSMMQISGNGATYSMGLASLPRAEADQSNTCFSIRVGYALA